MRLNEQNVELFLAVVPTFIASLPSSPLQTDAACALTAASLEDLLARTQLRTEVCMLLERVPKDLARFELPEVKCAEANQAFDGILYALGNLLRSPYERTGDHLPIKEKLVQLRYQISTGDKHGTPMQVRYFDPDEGATAAVQYRHHTMAPASFNRTLEQLFATENVEHSISTASDLPDRLNRGPNERDRELVAYRQQSVHTNALVTFMLAQHKGCGGHSTYVDLSIEKEGDTEITIETIMAQCNGGAKKRWFHVHWIRSFSATNRTQIQRNSPEFICEKLRKPRRDQRIVLEVAADGSWQEKERASSQSSRVVQVKLPQHRLADVLRKREHIDGSDSDQKPSNALVSIDRKLRASKRHRFGLGYRLATSVLCLVGSPLIRSRWRASNLLMTETASDETHDNSIRVYMDDISKLGSEVDKKHIVLDIGVLLWELFLMQPVQPKEEDREVWEDENGNYVEDEDLTLFNALNRMHHDRDDCDLLEPAQHDVIGNCLGLYEQLSELGDDELRMEVYDKIVGPLKNYARSTNDVSVSTITLPPVITPGAKSESASGPPTDHSGTGNEYEERLHLEHQSQFPSITVKTEVARTSRDPLQHRQVPRNDQQAPETPNSTCLPPSLKPRHAINLHIDFVPPEFAFSEHQHVVSAQNRHDPFTKDDCCKVEAIQELSAGRPVHHHEVGERLKTDCDTFRAIPYQPRDTTGLFNLHCHQGYHSGECEDSRDWIESFKDLRHRRDIRYSNEQPLKVAILDSGIDLKHPQVKEALAENRILGYESFVDNSDIQDRCGHGTHIAGLIIDLAENTQIYVAKIMDTAEARGDAVRQSIVRALQHVQTEWEVNFVSLSFGYLEPGSYDEVRKEIANCFHRNIVVFASASNDGGNAPRTYPGHYPNVMCIHSSTTAGKRSKFNPDPEENRDNFMVDGECLESWWPLSIAKGPNLANSLSNHLSGTSFATPMAVAIAAFMIGYIRANFPQHTWHVDPVSFEGMRKVFQQMSHPSDGYSLVSPQWFFNKYSGDQIRANLSHHRDGLGIRGRVLT